MKYYISVGLLTVGSFAMNKCKSFYDSKIKVLNKAEKECIEVSEGKTKSVSEGKLIFSTGMIEETPSLTDSELNIKFPANIPVIKREVQAYNAGNSEWISKSSADSEKVDFITNDALFIVDGFKINDLRFDRTYLTRNKSAFVGSKINLVQNDIAHSPGYDPTGETFMNTLLRTIFELEPAFTNRFKVLEDGTLFYKSHRYSLVQNDAKIEYFGKKVKFVSIIGKLVEDAVLPYILDGTAIEGIKLAKSTKQEMFAEMKRSAYISYCFTLFLGGLVSFSGLCGLFLSYMLSRVN